MEFKIINSRIVCAQCKQVVSGDWGSEFIDYPDGRYERISLKCTTCNTHGYIEYDYTPLVMDCTDIQEKYGHLRKKRNGGRG